MKNIIKFLFVFACGSLLSCNNFLDIKPKGIQIPYYFDDYARLLNDQAMMYSDHGYVNYLTDDVLLGEKELNYGRLDLAKEEVLNLYKFVHGPIQSSGSTDYLWENGYKRIYTLNVVINNVLSCPDASDTDKQALVAQAKVSRAFEYLTLVNMYGKHYDANTATLDLGVPIMLSEDINSSYVRNSVQQVYDQILKDVNDALTFIPNKAPHTFRVTKQVAHAFLSRVYLYMGNYEKAKTEAQEALNTGVTINDLCLYSINPAANGMGRIFIASTKEQFPNPEENPESIYTRYGTDILSQSLNVYGNPDLLNLYNKDLPVGATDQRRTLYFCDDSYKLYQNVYKFPGKSIWVPYINFNCGLNSTELYLILAESSVRTDTDGSGVTTALDILDLLRSKRILNNQTLSRSLTKDQVLAIVLDERRREFAFGGSIRVIDLKRLNKEDLFKKEITHTTGSETWTLPANDLRYILPIPPKVLGMNSTIPVYER